MRTSLIAPLGLLALIAVSGLDAPADDRSPITKELARFRGAWSFESVEAGGKKLPLMPFQGRTVVFDGARYSFKRGDKVEETATMTLDPSKSPKAFDATATSGPNKGAVMLGIYEFTDGNLKVCFDATGQKRPTKFETANGSSAVLVVHSRLQR